MAQPLTEMAKDLTLALIENKLLAPEDMQQQLSKTHASLLELKAHEDDILRGEVGKEGEAESRPQVTNWKKSIKKHSVECLVCGETFKQLSAKHLRQHDLDPRTYRKQFSIPRTQPLSAKETTATRRRIVQVIRPWEKTPAYMRAHKPAPVARPKRSRKKATATSE